MRYRCDEPMRRSKERCYTRSGEGGDVTWIAEAVHAASSQMRTGQKDI